MLADINVKIFADGADLDGILALADDPRISGFTTNPTLMWKAGLTDYQSFAQRLLERITKHPISFEVFADGPEEILRQARLIAAWGDNVYVKIPVTITTGETMAPVVRELSESGVKVNVTAVFTTAQVELVTAAVKDGAPSYVSVFAADHGAGSRHPRRRASVRVDLGVSTRDSQRRTGGPDRLPHHHHDA
jgi:transaldolase